MTALAITPDSPLAKARMARILELAGYGHQTDAEIAGVWGADPAEGAAIRVTDAFIRSVGLAADDDMPIGLNLDGSGAHFDPAQPSDLESLLRDNPLDDTALLNRAKAGMAAMQVAHLSQYNAFDPALPVPDPGYVLVIDQPRDAASVQASSADSNTFREMLFYAQTENPGAQIIIKAHPAVIAGHAKGYFKDSDLNERITLSDQALSPWHLLEGAVAVYTVSSHMGFEAILAGHKPIVFGQPFYAGWGLTDDRNPVQRRQRVLTRAQMFAAAMILYPIWYDPYHDRLCSFEEAVATMTALAGASRDDYRGWTALGIRLWKRGPLQRVFGAARPVKFARNPAKDTDRRKMRWANKAQGDDAVLVEDGFLRSRGLGADLIAPLSLVLDDVGIYYDATRPSRLEDLLNAAQDLPDGPRARAAALIDRIKDARLSKYNLGAGSVPDLPKGRRILVPGQVEDDASIRLGAVDVNTNQGLLKAVRAANPAAVVIYKPHPDVEAGLRPGALPNAEALADVVVRDTDPITLLDHVDEVWTMTSLLGFEALLRGGRVTCLGTPFYAGWGLTDDRTMPVTRRTARLDLPALVHATLIDYPRYFDPVTGMACPVEVIVDRLENNDIPAPGRMNRLVAKAQGLAASFAPLWRR